MKYAMLFIPTLRIIDVYQKQTECVKIGFVNLLFEVTGHFHILIFFSVPVKTSGQRTKREEDGYSNCSHSCCMRRLCGKWSATLSIAYLLYCMPYNRRYRPVFCNEAFIVLTVYCSIPVRDEWVYRLYRIDHC